MLSVIVLSTKSWLDVCGRRIGLKDALPSGVVGAVETSFSANSSVSGTSPLRPREDIVVSLESACSCAENGRIVQRPKAEKTSGV